jgi:hypothetical protein
MNLQKFNSGDFVMVSTEGHQDALILVKRILEPDPLIGLARFEGELQRPITGAIVRRVFLTDSVVKVFPRPEKEKAEVRLGVS